MQYAHFNDSEVLEIVGNHKLEDLVQYLAAQLSNEQLVKFIKLLDAEMEDYDASKELRDYFIQAIREEDAVNELEGGPSSDGHPLCGNDS